MMIPEGSSKSEDLLQFFARQAVGGGGGGGGGPHRKSMDMGDEGTYKFRGDKDKAGPMMAWAPTLNMGPIEPSDTDSIEGSSVEASPPTR